MLARIPATAAPELELKFQLGTGAIEALGEVFPLDSGTTSLLHAVYFDTPGHVLRDAGFSLRVRRKGAVHVQTLKHRAAGGLFERDEWETVVSGPHLDMAVLAATPAAALVGDAVLAPVFTVEVERRVHIWTSGEARVEVSFDTGRVLADGRHDPVAEMELELLAGSPQTLFLLAHNLQAKAALTLSFESKAERGYRLVGHDGVAALRARNAAISNETLSAIAFQMVARDALVQIAGNARLLQRAHNPEVLHQIRVGLRRFRAALSIFKAMLDSDGLESARRETRWLALELSPARDIDVFLQNAATRDEIEEDPGRAAFFRALRIAQAEAYERALAAIDTPRFRSLLLSLGEWIEAGAWLQQTKTSSRKLREQPAVDLAAPVMDKLDHRLRRRSQRFMRLGVKNRHDLRKQAKKLRYAAAFFGEAFTRSPKRRQRLTTALRAVQDRLGELNDMSAAQTVAMRAVGRKSSELAFAAGLEVGRLTQNETALLKAADAALKDYRKAKPFWRRTSKDINLSRPPLRSV